MPKKRKPADGRRSLNRLDSRCVVCERPLKPSPTKRWWVTLRYKEGICYECIINLNRNVLCGLQHAVDEAAAIVQDHAQRPAPPVPKQT